MKCQIYLKDYWKILYQLKIYDEENSPVDDAEYQEANGVDYLHPELNPLGHDLSSFLVKNCCGDEDDHTAKDEDETRDEPKVHVG